ncbi:MAG: LysM peptidoglycan-binding domain-containing protein [Bacteroidales bacterium]|nr:LysM peptidoglycan-binding domain-containing protein [Bacteroidales bacterium]MBQ9722985.1 LysM peptidoglycan-binding domain-containing protein [Bacteroidales bacterium]
MERNIFKTLVLAVALSCAVPAAINAQEYVSAPVTVSKDKVKVNGKVCWSHIVRDKQTLFSIAKAYDVSVDDIYAFNPTLKETGLKKNSIILIPSKEALESKKATSAGKTEPAAKPEPEKKQEPAVKTEPEKKPEPAVKPERVKKEEPKQKAEPKPKAQKKQKTHTVKWYEDLDVIADKYGVTVEEIMKANNLTGRKLTKRQKLVIPEPGEIVVDEPQEEVTVVPEEDTTVTEEPADTTTADVPETEPDWFFKPKDEVKATLILPLKASTDNVSRNNMDFYSGVLLAVKDLADSGISTDLNVYDSSDSSHPISSEDLTGSDMIIGPVSSGDLGRLLNSETQPEMVISPLDQRAESLAYTHDNLIQVPTPQNVQYQDLIDWIREDTMPGDTLLLISEKGARNSDAVAMMTQAADSSGLGFKTFSYSILEGRDITKTLTGLMTATGTNRVLIASESEAFVNDVVRNLNILVYNKLNVALYAPARIRSFETIEVENLHNTNLHVSLGYLIDYESPQVKNFLLKYRALYNMEPTQYAFQGYDVASYFISMCSKYGNRWVKKLDDSERQMLQSTFRMVPVEDGGYVNHGVRRVVYGPEWSVTKVR